MTVPSPPHLALALGLALGLAPAGAHAETLRAAVVQFIADVTLIDRECPHDAVDFGVAFQYAESNGVVMVELMPTGAHRAEMEKALRLRSDTARRPELCDGLSEHYARLVPGLIARR